MIRIRLCALGSQGHFYPLENEGTARLKYGNSPPPIWMLLNPDAVVSENYGFVSGNRGKWGSDVVMCPLTPNRLTMPSTYNPPL